MAEEVTEATIYLLVKNMQHKKLSNVFECNTKEK